MDNSAIVGASRAFAPRLNNPSNFFMPGSTIGAPLFFDGAVSSLSIYPLPFPMISTISSLSFVNNENIVVALFIKVKLDHRSIALGATQQAYG